MFELNTLTAENFVPTKSELWQMFEPIAHELGLMLFEMEVPNSKSRVLRIYLAPGKNAPALPVDEDLAPREEQTSGKRGVTLDECAQFSKRLSRMEGFEDLFHDRWTLEVSSPGINRKLTRPEHFEGALGERVKVKYRGAEEKNEVSRGKLTAFDGQVLTIEDEERGAVTVACDLVSEARVDFLFTRER